MESVNLDNIRKFFSHIESHVIVICDSEAEFAALHDAVWKLGSYSSYIFHLEVGEHYMNGRKCGIDLVLDKTGSPKWEGWSVSDYYADVNCPVVSFSLLRQGNMPEELFNFTKEELEKIWEV